ncbi:MAG: bifunctional chorismate mutase/prephenate dehydrogenase [Nanoarchaeota archaeon]
MENEINDLRIKIDSIDSKLVNLLDERLEIAVAIGEIKKKMKLGVEQNGREDRVLERAMTAKHPESMVSIFQNIMDSSKVEQAKMAKAENFDMNLNVGVMGFGMFGQFLARNIKSRCNVEVWDIVDKSREAKELGVKFVSFEKIAKNKIVILAMPMESVEEILDKLKNKLEKGTLVMDICSLKGFVCKLMKEKLPSSVDVLGTHPLFGPQSAKFGISGAKIVLCPVKIGEERLSKVKEFCESLGLNVFLASPEEHDKQMAASQALTHFVGQAINQSGIKRVEWSTKTFDSLMNIADIIRKDSPEMVRNIQTLNPFAKDMRRKFIDEVKKIETELNCLEEKHE